MTALQVYSPFADAGFEDFVRGFFKPLRQVRESAEPIKVDVVEKGDAYVVKAELPGVKKDDIQVTVEGNQVTISAEVKRETEQKDGERVPFDRQKVLSSLRIACNKRPVTPDQLDRTADDIETELALLGEKEVSSLMIGERVMARLKELDDVAYVRFASVYKSFRDIDEFMREVGSLVRARPEE